jgi:hypothetical protein
LWGSISSRVLGVLKVLGVLRVLKVLGVLKVLKVLKVLEVLRVLEALRMLWVHATREVAVLAVAIALNPFRILGIEAPEWLRSL